MNLVFYHILWYYSNIFVGYGMFYDLFNMKNMFLEKMIGKYGKVVEQDGKIYVYVSQKYVDKAF